MNLRSYLKALGLGDKCQIVRAILSIWDTDTWPSGDILVTESAFASAMGIAPEATNTTGRISARLSELNKKVIETGRTFAGRNLPPCFGTPFSTSTGQYVILVFDMVLAEYLLTATFDSVCNVPALRGKAASAAKYRLLEKHYKCAPEDLCRLGKPFGPGRWLISSDEHVQRAMLDQTILRLTLGTADNEKSYRSRVIGLWGFPGVGKTYSARFVVDSKTPATPPDGAAEPESLWPEGQRCFVHLGPCADNQAVGARAEELRATFAGASEQERYLVVLDDARSAAQVLPFLEIKDLSRCCFLITTQNRRILEDLHLAEPDKFQWSFIQIPRMTQDESLSLFALSCRSRSCIDEREQKDLVGLCGGIPLAVKILAGILGERPERAAGLKKLLASEATRVRTLQKFLPDYTPDDAFSHGGESILVCVIGACISHFLLEDERDSLMLLAATRPGTQLPQQALSTIWMFSEDAEKEAFLERLVALSLIEESGTKDVFFCLDMPHAYLVAFANKVHNKKKNEGPEEVHMSVLRAYATRYFENGAARFDGGEFLPWWEIEDDGYILDNLGFHLCSAGREQEFTDLLTDSPLWLETKRRRLHRDLYSLSDIHVAISQICGEASVSQRLSLAKLGVLHITCSESHSKESEVLLRLAVCSGAFEQSERIALAAREPEKMAHSLLQVLELANATCQKVPTQIDAQINEAIEACSDADLRTLLKSRFCMALINAGRLEAAEGVLATIRCCVGRTSHDEKAQGADEEGRSEHAPKASARNTFGVLPQIQLCLALLWARIKREDTDKARALLPHVLKALEEGEHGDGVLKWYRAAIPVLSSICDEGELNVLLERAESIARSIAYPSHRKEALLELSTSCATAGHLKKAMELLVLADEVELREEKSDKESSDLVDLKMHQAAVCCLLGDTETALRLLEGIRLELERDTPGIGRAEATIELCEDLLGREDNCEDTWPLLLRIGNCLDQHPKTTASLRRFRSVLYRLGIVLPPALGQYIALRTQIDWVDQTRNEKLAAVIGTAARGIASLGGIETLYQKGESEEASATICRLSSLGVALVEAGFKAEAERRWSECIPLLAELPSEECDRLLCALPVLTMARHGQQGLVGQMMGILAERHGFRDNETEGGADAALFEIAVSLHRLGYKERAKRILDFCEKELPERPLGSWSIPSLLHAASARARMDYPKEALEWFEPAVQGDQQGWYFAGGRLGILVMSARDVLCSLLRSGDQSHNIATFLERLKRGDKNFEAVAGLLCDGLGLAGREVHVFSHFLLLRISDFASYVNEELVGPYMISVPGDAGRERIDGWVDQFGLIDFLILRLVDAAAGDHSGAAKSCKIICFLSRGNLRIASKFSLRFSTGIPRGVVGFSTDENGAHDGELLAHDGAERGQAVLSFFTEMIVRFA